MTTNVLVTGSGGRAHAEAWKLSQSPDCGRVYVMPGNPGTAEIATNVEIDPKDFAKGIAFCKRRSISLVICQEDNLLDAGLVDAYRREGIRVCGSTQAASRIESSKAYCRSIAEEKNIAMARGAAFTAGQVDEAIRFVVEIGVPVVVKADGLALGKGAKMYWSTEQAAEAIRAIASGKSYHGNTSFVVEAFLKGDELSGHYATDGRCMLPFPLSQDHKQIGEGGIGDNTGGMGVIVPVPWVTNEIQREANRAARLLFDGLNDRGNPHEGIMYPGFMWTGQRLALLESNTRFGDPEAEAYLRLMKSDYLKLCVACAERKLSEYKPEWHDGYAISVTLASRGYPGTVAPEFKNQEITGIEEAEKVPEVIIFHAGTALKNGKLVNVGGRVLMVTARGRTFEEAQGRAYEAVSLIHFAGMYFRRDIGAKSLLMSRRAA